MKRTIRILLAAVLVAVTAGGYWFYQSRAATTASSASGQTYTQIVDVTQGSLNSSLSVVGQLEAKQSANLAFEQMSGTTNLLTLAVQAGNVVTTGQVLATIDPAPYEQARDQARSDLQAAEEALSDLQTPATTLAIAQADVAVSTAKQALAQANDKLADFKSPDLTSLRSAVQDAQDSLALLQLQATLAGHESLAKSERDLQYAVSWYQRRIAELQALSNPNAEQIAEIPDDQVSLAEAQADLARVQVERELARQSRAAEAAKANVVLADAQEALAEAQAGGDKLALAQAELALHQAEVALQAAQEARTDLDAGADATKIAAAQAAVDKKRLTLSDAEAALAGAQLLAPFAGTILQTNVNVDDQVTANTTILTLANLGTLQVVASVDETTIRQISAGQDATITFDAFPGQSLQGKVLTVPLQGSLQGGVMVYAVPVSLSGADNLALLVGMTANVEIQVGQAADALLVPTLALTKANGLYQVLVPNSTDPNGDPVAVPVEVGLSDGIYTQIVKGLNPGDQVVVQMASTTSSASSGGGSGGSMMMNVTRQLGGR
ncbi:MAG: efflux RND transporter periplasmic adaptor subunit [Anaerolineae bacterium]